MRKNLFLSLITLVVLFVASVSARASHLTGVDGSYVFIGDSAGIYHYRVMLNIYQDLIDGDPTAIEEDNPAFIAVFDGLGNRVAMDSLSSMSAAILTTDYDGPCLAIDSLVPVSISRRTFVKDYYLPASSTGYNITYQRCCMNGGSVNVTGSEMLGISYCFHIPPSGVADQNNSAVFVDFTPTVLPVDSAFLMDMSATDVDGDSLSYEICQTYTGGNDADAKPLPIPPPFDTVAFIAPLTYHNPVTCAVPLAINAATGMLTGTPSAAGQYIFTICCHEWRSGVLISTIQRELEIKVTDCASIAAFYATNAIHIFPNPATGVLSIEAKQLITKVDIYNSYGYKVQEGVYDAHVVKINVSELPAGVYFIRTNGGHSQKFVKR